jgi:chromosome segregation ATPase
VQANGTPTQVEPEIDYKAIIADKDKELEMVRQHAGEITQQLRRELEKAQENYRTADVQASTNGAEAQFHRDRAERAVSDLDALQRQIQEMSNSRAKCVHADDTFS